MIPRGAWRAFLLVLATATVACGERRDPAGQTVLVAAASSLRDLLVATAPDFEKAAPGARIEIAFGGSSTLARQLHEGAPFDVLLSADAESLARVRGDLARESIRPFLSNRLALVARAGLARPAASPRDLAGADVRLALAMPEVPAGRYARAFLAKAGLLDPLAGAIVNTDDVRAALALVEAGSADYAIVYETDARAARNAVLVWVATGQDDPGIAYVLARAARSRSAAAEAYLSWLRGDSFQAAAARLGFRSPPP